MGWFCKNKNLGTYVKYSKHTAKLNPQMIRREFERVINEHCKQIKDIENDINSTKICITGDVISKAYHTRADNLKRDTVFEIDLKNFELPYNSCYTRDIVGGIDALRSVIRTFDMQLHKLDVLKKELDEMKNESNMFYHEYILKNSY